MWNYLLDRKFILDRKYINFYKELCVVFYKEHVRYKNTCSLTRTSGFVKYKKVFLGLGFSTKNTCSILQRTLVLLLQRTLVLYTTKNTFSVHFFCTLFLYTRYLLTYFLPTNYQLNNHHYSLLSLTGALMASND